MLKDTAFPSSGKPYEKESSFPKINRLTAETSVTRLCSDLPAVTSFPFYAQMPRNSLILSAHQLNV
jgi:hypothetical protein